MVLPSPWLLMVVFGTFVSVGALGAEHAPALLQSWSRMLDGESSKEQDTPVTRVVGLLKEMGQTVNKEMEEDEALFHKLQCWCTNNNWEKGNSIEASENKIGELKSTIESLTGSTAELRASIKELEAQFTADKNALAMATALRNKQLSDFHEMEKDDIQAIENLKAALVVLGKHHEAPPESTVEGGAIFKSERDSWSLLEVASKGKDFPSKDMRSLDNFMRDNQMEGSATLEENPSDAGRSKFLQKSKNSMSTESEWSVEDAATVKQAVKTASAFVQSRQNQGYFPAYFTRSGEIIGVLRQLKEEMEGDLSGAQKQEMMRAEAFAELRGAKTQQIESAEKMAEDKEDLLANQDNLLAEAKEDLGQEEASLAADQKFVKNLKETCADADKNFNERKLARMTEMTAISDTVQILQGDVARDAMTGTFSFVQVKADSRRNLQSNRRAEAAEFLRRAAKAAQDPQLSVLATSVQLDAFTKVKKAIDNMISMLKQQQEDEVKKNNYCKEELQSNEMATAKKQTQREDLEAKITTLDQEIKALESAIADAKSQIAKSQLELQRATENRKEENLDFQKVVADQTVTIAVLHQALDRLAKYYDLVQTKGSSWIQRQTPDVAQKEYSKSKGASGAMEMVEKLIYDARELMADSKKSESEAQAAYEQLIADTNDNVRALQREITSKTQSRREAAKDKHLTESDLTDAIKELEGLAKYNAELHVECDYLLKNFDVRQQGRAEEVVALQQAKQILNGAALN